MFLRSAHEITQGTDHCPVRRARSITDRRVALFRFGGDKNSVEGASAAADRNRIGCGVHAASHTHRVEAGIRAYRFVANY